MLETPIRNQTIYTARNISDIDVKCQKVQTLTRRCVGDAVAGLGLHFLHMSESPFSNKAGHLVFLVGYVKWPVELVRGNKRLFLCIAGHPDTANRACLLTVPSSR